MWFMNNACNYILQKFYPPFEKKISPSVFTKAVYNIIIELDEWIDIYNEIKDIYDPNTAPKSIRQLGGKFRTDFINDVLEKNRIIIMSEVHGACQGSNSH